MCASDSSGCGPTQTCAHGVRRQASLEVPRARQYHLKSFLRRVAASYPFCFQGLYKPAPVSYRTQNSEARGGFHAPDPKKKRSSRRQPPLFLTQEEERALLAQVSTKSTTGLRDRPMLRVMLGAGLRVSEVVKLMPADIGFAEGMVRVNDGKGGKDRIVPVDGETLAWLQVWAEKRKALGLNGRQHFFCRIRTNAGATPLAAGEGITTRTVGRSFTV